MTNGYKNLIGKPEEQEPLREDLDEDDRTILEWILQKWVGKVWNGFIWLRIGTSSGLL
jgi:hypothetical protein